MFKAVGRYIVPDGFNHVGWAAVVTFVFFYLLPKCCLKLVRTLLNIRVLGTRTAAIFLSNDHVLFGKDMLQA